MELNGEFLMQMEMEVIFPCPLCLRFEECKRSIRGDFGANHRFPSLIPTYEKVNETGRESGRESGRVSGVKWEGRDWLA